MSSQKFCENCGKPLPADKTATFCGNCGATIPGVSEGYSQPPTYQSGTSAYQQPISSIRKGQFPEEQPGSIPQRFIKVLTSPSAGMTEITRAPEYMGPLLVSFLLGVLLCIASLIQESKIHYNFTGTTGFPEIDAIMEQAFVLVSVFSAVISLMSFVIGVFIWGIILWILLAILSNLSPEDRSFKRSMSIVGYAWVPQIIGAIINPIYLFFFYPSTTVTLDLSGFITGNIDLSSLSSATEGLNLPIEILGFVLFLWSLILVYSALKSLEVPRDRIIIICGLYGILGLYGLVNSLLTSILLNYLGSIF